MSKVTTKGSTKWENTGGILISTNVDESSQQAVPLLMKQAALSRIKFPAYVQIWSRQPYIGPFVHSEIFAFLKFKLGVSNSLRLPRTLVPTSDLFQSLIDFLLNIGMVAIRICETCYVCRTLDTALLHGIYMKPVFSGGKSAPSCLQPP